MQTLRGILIKTCSKTMQRIYTRVSLQGRSLINSMHAPSTTPIIALPCFHLLNCKGLLQVVSIPQWYFATYATRSINIGTFKMFKQNFKIIKPEVLKATSFIRWNETVFQKFCDTYCLCKILFKNVCINSFRTLCFLSFVADVIVSNVIEAGPNVYQCLGVPL